MPAKVVLIHEVLREKAFERVGEVIQQTGLVLNGGDGSRCSGYVDVHDAVIYPSLFQVFRHPVGNVYELDLSLCLEIEFSRFYGHFSTPHSILFLSTLL